MPTELTKMEFLRRMVFLAREAKGSGTEEAAALIASAAAREWRREKTRTPRRSGVCVFTTQLHVGEYSTSQTATLIPRSILFVLFEAPLNSPRAFSLPLRFSSAA